VITRRQALRIWVAGGAALGLSWGLRRAYPQYIRPKITREKSLRPAQHRFAQSPTSIRKFFVSLPGLGPSAANEIGQYIPEATKTEMNIAGVLTDVYRLGVAPFRQRMHPDLPGETPLWGYYDMATSVQKYLGGAIVATRGRPVLLEVTNQLPNQSLVPVDPTIMASSTQTVGQLPMNRIATHLHGGFTPWFSDGTPFQWYTPGGQHGPSFMNVPGTSPAAGTATQYYPMDQSARLLWYHDHAIGITRTNVYSGLASVFLITDTFESELIAKGLLPPGTGTPLVIQDKTFVPADVATQDPTWPGGPPGSLWYPHVYEPLEIGGTGLNPACSPNPTGRWDYGPCADPKAVLPADSFYTLPTPASIVPEAFFDTILVNGGVYPVVRVPPKRVRFRMLNASQARFYHLNLYHEDASRPGEAMVGTPGPIMYQVANEGGFLPAVARHNNTTAMPLDLVTDPSGNTAVSDGPFNLLLSPAERADVIIDFNRVAEGQSFILYNDSPAPFPGGDPLNDYFTGDPNQTGAGGAPTTAEGFGPNTRTLLKIVVTAGSADTMGTAEWLSTLNPLLAANFTAGQQPPLLFKGPLPYTGPIHRQLTLAEDFDDYGRLIQTLGTLELSGDINNQGVPMFGRPYDSAATETPTAGAVEVWQLYNTTADTHPIHFHLVNVQIIQRQAFNGDPASGVTLTGPVIPPDPNEKGWKETVRMNPGEATTIIMQFNLPSLPSSMGNPTSPRTGGHEYVWHCHILEHEEHDMMRPLVVS
jgi:spore coat protein A, manganese oxidase